MNTWLWMSVFSGILLGFYDIFTKKALEKVSLLNVLALYTFFSFLLVSYEYKNAFGIDTYSLFLIAIKSVIIFGSWILGFISIRSLPISIISPFSTLTPVFTIILGIALLHEQLGIYQSLGILVILSSYYLIGKTGSTEITSLFKNKYLYLMAASTLLSAVSALLDKIILKTANSGQMQFWFSLFLTLFYFGAMGVHSFRQGTKLTFAFSWYIPLMSLFLIVSDRIYFEAVNMTASKISVILPLRRISVLVSAIVGGWVFHERNLRRKFLYTLLLVAGIAIVFIFK